MNRAELDVIKARCKTATPGPWEAGFTGAHTFQGNAVWRLTPFLEGETVSIRREDAEFMARARKDIPALIAEIEACWGILEGFGLLRR